MLDEIIIKYLFGKTADKLIDVYKGNELSNKIDQAFRSWMTQLPQKLFLDPETFF